MMDSGDTKVTRLLRWQAGQTPGPWEIVVFPTNRCNLRCRMCWQRWAEKEFGKVDYASEVDDERLLRLVDEGAEMGVREWTMVGGGEPMVRSDLVMEMCRRIRQKGMNGAIQTNGTLFKHEQLEELVDLEWDRILVSIDGPNAEINNAIRGPNSFERATSNLRFLADVKKKQGRKKPNVSIITVVTNLVHDKLDQMILLAHELDCVGVGVSDLLVQGDMCAELALDERQRAELNAHLPRAMEAARQHGIHENFGATYDAADQVLSQHEPVEGGGELANALCYEPWLTLAVLAEEGKAGPCCVFWEQKVDTIKDNTLEEVWLGPYMQDVRQKIKTRRNIPDYCKNCCSNIPMRTLELRDSLLQLQWMQDQNVGRMAMARRMAGKLIVNLRNRGLRQSIKRGREWLMIRAKTRTRN